MENRQEFLKLRREQQIERELDGYVEWICKAEELILTEERTTEETKNHIMEARRRAAAKKKKLKNMGKSTDTEDEEGDFSEEGKSFKAIHEKRSPYQKLLKKPRTKQNQPLSNFSCSQ